MKFATCLGATSGMNLTLTGPLLVSTFQKYAAHFEKATEGNSGSRVRHTGWIGEIILAADFSAMSFRTASITGSAAVAGGWAAFSGMGGKSWGTGRSVGGAARGGLAMVEGDRRGSGIDESARHSTIRAFLM